MDAEARSTGWTGFWNRGGWWKALALAAAYLAVYQLSAMLISSLTPADLELADPFAGTGNVFFALTAPLLVGAVALAAFTASVRWFPALFGAQPIRGRWWYWLAPAFVLLAIVLRLIGIDYGSFVGGVVALVLLSGLLIGLVEEVLTRGIAVKLLRDRGHSEWTVMVLSSLLFALLHATNLFSGQPVVTVLATMGFTFAFGVCMYLTLRATGSLIWPIVLHGLYDPTLFLATGGIDVAGEGPQNVFLTLAAPANIIYIVLAVVALVFVRGRVSAR